MLTGLSLIGQALAFVPAHADSLEDAMSAAYAVNPRLKAERSRYRATNQDIWTARSEFLPTVTGSYLAEHNAYDYGSSSQGSEFTHELNLTMSQTLFQGLAGVNRLNQAHEVAVSGRNQLISVEQNLLLDTADAYLRVVRDREIVSRLKAYTAVVQREVTATRTRFKSGDATKTDTEQTLARLAEAQGNTDQVIGDLEASEALYERLTGQKPGKLGWPAVPVSLLPKNPDEAVAIALQNNPAIRAATADARAARYAARASLGDMLPSVTLESTWENDYQDDFSTRNSEEFRVGLRVTAPLFTGGRNIASVRRANFTAEEEKYHLDDTKQIIRENVIRAMKQRTASRSRAEAGKRAIAANRKAVKGLQVELESGQRSLLEVLDGERELLLSQVDYVRARFDARIADFLLLANVGRLAPEHFSIIGERPDAVPRLVPAFNSLDLRLATSENDTIPIEVTGSTAVSAAPGNRTRLAGTLTRTTGPSRVSLDEEPEASAPQRAANAIWSALRNLGFRGSSPR